MTTLNAAFKSKIALEDEGYDSGSKNFNIPTPLRRTFKIHHISHLENASFDPHPVMPCSTGTRKSHCKLVHDAYISVLLRKMIMTPQQMRFHLQTVQCQCSIT